MKLKLKNCCWVLGVVLLSPSSQAQIVSDDILLTTNHLRAHSALPWQPIFKPYAYQSLKISFKDGALIKISSEDDFESVDNSDLDEDDQDEDWDDDWEEDWESDSEWGDDSTEDEEEQDAKDDDSESDSSSSEKKPDTFWGNLEFDGELAPEVRFFPRKGFNDQARGAASVRLEPEWYSKWNDDKNIFMLQLFWRQDQRDSHRTHGDIRELYWQYADKGWNFKLGISKVFWGVAETRHLVDIINQTDLVENLDGEQKLGQPMAHLSYSGDFGTIEGFLLPIFRERTFQGQQGRLRSIPRVDDQHVVFQSSKAHHHLDYAIRYSHHFGPIDLGLNYFRGTNRDPLFDLHFINGDILLLPIYTIIQEYSTDIQATLGNWLFKFEGLVRKGQQKTFNAQVAGFEYTQVGIFESNMDLGYLLEYHHDKRGQNLTPFNNDIAAGFRLAFNDTQDTEILGFVLWDRHLSSQFYRIEASRRLHDSFKLNVEATWFANVNRLDPLSFLRRDHFVQAELIYYF